ncbi:MAG: hypothetical protein GIKADHBN_00913 [Phycisphaerales bacterium]|nr:hypothetical protein [Phycisphaerales bacterium]
MDQIRFLALLPFALNSVAAATPPGQSPELPSVVLDLRTTEGVDAVQGEWRYTDAQIVETTFLLPGPDSKPSSTPTQTHDILPRINTPEFESASWVQIPATSLETRRTTGKLSCGWYRLDLTLPERVGDFDVRGCDAVFEIVADDYAEVWIDGKLSQVLGQAGGGPIGGWNTPTRIVLARDLQPGREVHVAVFAANGPLSDPPSNYVWIRSATLDFYRPGQAMINRPETVPITLTRLDPEFDRIASPGSSAERLAEGFAFTEGPAWIPPLDRTAEPHRTYGGGGLGGYLLFSDPNKNVIHRWDPVSGQVSIFRTKSGYTGIGGAAIGEYHQPGSNGLALDPQGRLTICEHGNRRVTRLEPNGSITVLADRYEGHRLNSPNDLVYRSDGALFFTDPPFGLPLVFDDPRKELGFSGVYCMLNGTLRLVSRDLSGPNGLAFSPDEKYLYVDNWDEHRKVVLRYQVAVDGSLSNPTTFVDLTSIPGGTCFDGLKVDAEGNVYVSAPGGIRVYSPGGVHLGTISLPELPANFAFGDADRRTLFMTARTGLYRMRIGIPGAGR